METLAEKGWSDKSNGELLHLAEQEGYEIPVTTDRSLRYQQNPGGRHIGIVALFSANWPEIRSNGQEIGQTISAVRPSEVIEVPIPAK